MQRSPGRLPGGQYTVWGRAQLMVYGQRMSGTAGGGLRAAGSGTARLLDHAARTPHDRARSRLRAGANVFTVLFPESSDGTEFALTARSLRRPRTPQPSARHPPRRACPARPPSIAIVRIGVLSGTAAHCSRAAKNCGDLAPGRPVRRAVHGWRTDISRAGSEPCLLYTSPSPRD